MWQALVLSGQAKNPEILRELIKAADLIWAGDGGLDHLMDLAITPDFYVGDGDSLSHKGQAYLDDSKISQETFPILKDETDSALALHRMLSKDLDFRLSNNAKISKSKSKLLAGPSGLMFLAALGNRWDHVLANLDLGSRYARPDLPILMTDGETFIWTLKGPFEMMVPLSEYLPNPERKYYYSLLAISDEVKGLSFENVLWPLENRTLYRGFSLGVSNEPKGNLQAKLSFKSGLLRLIISSEQK